MIKQKYKRDCAICCIAMAASLDYEEVAEAAGRWFNPFFGTTNIEGVLKKLNIPFTEVDNIPNTPALVSFVTGKMERGYSINHMVYYDGEEFHDPSNNPNPNMIYNDIYRIIAL